MHELKKFDVGFANSLNKYFFLNISLSLLVQKINSYLNCQFKFFS